jgi:hypothetical protein
MMLRRSSVVGIFGIPILLACCILYYFEFAANLSSYNEATGLFQFALNSHDHFIYVDTMYSLRNWGFELGINNDFGIALFFLPVRGFLGFIVGDDLPLISLLFNCFVLVLCYWVYGLISEKLHLGLLGKLSFFANLSLIYFAQLINKDMLTIFFFLLSIYLCMTGRTIFLLVLTPLLFLVRLQLAAYSLILIYFMLSKNPVKRIMIAYIITSVVAGYLSVFASVIGEDSLGSGFSSYLIAINKRFLFTGYLIFNPARVVQYIVDAYASFYLWTPSGGIDTARLLRLPQLIVIALLIKPMARLVSNFRYWLDTPARPLVLSVVSYLLAWLMNPTINARYVMLITPVLILFALYARHLRRRGLA